MKLDFDVDLTNRWWAECLVNPAKMNAWLQKLQRTEISGYDDHIKFLVDFPELTTRQKTILFNIAVDEKKHSNLLIETLMQPRGIEVDPNGEQSLYWDSVLDGVGTFEEYCAANYFGALASFRFGAILAHHDTPDDIKDVLKIILPDEVFHRETLMRLAGEDELVKMKMKHDAAYANLVRGRT
jgi:hypothetical protein